MSQRVKETIKGTALSKERWQQVDNILIVVGFSLFKAVFYLLWLTKTGVNCGLVKCTKINQLKWKTNMKTSEKGR